MALMLFRTELGDPHQLRSVVDQLMTRADVIRQTADRLHEVSTHGVWEAPSGRRFAEHVGQCPDVLHRFANTLEDSAQVIRPYADRLAEDQREMRALRDRYEDLDREADALEVRLCGLTPQDPDYPGVERQWRETVDEREMTKRRYQRAGEEATSDEEDVARRLVAIGDEMSDPAGYDFFEGWVSLAHSGAVNNVIIDWIPAARVVKLAKVGDPIGQLGLRMFYAQGSYSAAGKAVGTALLDVVKPPPGVGAVADDAVRKVTRRSELTSAKARHAGQANGGGTRAQRVRSKAKATARQTTAQVSVRTKHVARDGFENITGIRLVNDMTADWVAIAGAGRVTKGRYAVRHSLGTAQRVDSTMGAARATGEVIAPLASSSESTTKSVAPGVPR